jgi:glycosyltransferase involved in cell wall biosynthesis
VQNPWNKDLIKVQELAEKNKNIFRLGFIPSEDLVGLYNAATLFVMPSVYEGFGLPILEAMSCGCPVVASKEGSLAEVVGEAGEYVDPYDAKSISDGIRKVFDSQDLQKGLSQKGITQSRKFTWNKTAEETMSVYEAVAGNT